MTEEKEVQGTIPSLPGAIVIAGLTGNLERQRCPIGVGHDEDINISLSWAEFLVNILYLPKPSNEGKIFEIKDLKRMTKKQEIQLFNDRRIRTIWDDKEEKQYFSVVDVVEALTDSPDPSNYWRVLKNRLKKEGNETITICNAFKLPA